jgi:DNA helicase-2/ATP-dependent DNA helicase PcrA
MFEEFTVITPDNTIDDHVDSEIQSCISQKKNFFMFAGAGSGKTRSLVNALQFIAEKYGMALRLCSRRVAVITYTNAACDEIMRRIGYTPLFAVSTIHSFLWELIKPYQKDIKEWVKGKVEIDIDEQNEKLKRARKPEIYIEKIAKLNQRLESLKSISKFTYSPNGENIGRDSLDHSEVISMGSVFIKDKETMQKVMVSKFPILLIDESQDTKKELVDALLKIEQKYANDFIIGMFGDTMQRIYPDGQENLSKIVPPDWEKPAKLMNHRSTKRVIQLANAIRNTVDGQQQQARSDKSEGFVRLFVIPDTAERDSTEKEIYTRMAEITGDNKWSEVDERKTLVLEHSMAASRLGFGTIDNRLRTTFGQSFREGTLVELSFLMNIVFPVVYNKQNGNDFAVMKILKKYSPKLKGGNFVNIPDQLSTLQSIRMNVNELVSLWENGKMPICLDVYKKLYEINLFELPKRIDDILSDSDINEEIVALREGLSVPFSELINYWKYVNDKTQFSTHQGIKGLEFKRVAVIMDDKSAGGFSFSYEKLFGAQYPTDADLMHEKKGEDNSISRTKRLFYVTCTRAEKSLALIAYTNNVNDVKRTVISNGWFSCDEIISI